MPEMMLLINGEIVEYQIKIMSNLVKNVNMPCISVYILLHIIAHIVIKTNI